MTPELMAVNECSGINQKSLKQEDGAPLTA
jgi:hypothetical protein